MELSVSDVRKVALLARLSIADGEMEKFAHQMANIVHFVETLSEVNTEGIEPMAHPMDIHSVLRPDRLHESLPRDQALHNAPNQDGSCFLVPAVLPRKS